MKFFLEKETNTIYCIITFYTLIVFLVLVYFDCFPMHWSVWNYMRTVNFVKGSKLVESNLDFLDNFITFSLLIIVRNYPEGFNVHSETIFMYL